MRTSGSDKDEVLQCGRYFQQVGARFNLFRMAFQFRENAGGFARFVTYYTALRSVNKFSEIEFSWEIIRQESVNTTVKLEFERLYVVRFL